MTKVLIIDDYQEHLDTLSSTLQMYGCETKTASKGADALDIAREWAPQLIICDGMLESMHAWKFGFELLSNYSYDSNSDEIEGRPYLVALTGYASTKQRRLCEETGYNEYVTKPIELSTLLAWVQKAKSQ